MEPRGFWGTQPPPRTPFPWDGGSGVFNVQVWGWGGCHFYAAFSRTFGNRAIIKTCCATLPAPPASRRGGGHRGAESREGFPLRAHLHKARTWGSFAYSARSFRGKGPGGARVGSGGRGGGCGCPHSPVLPLGGCLPGSGLSGGSCGCCEFIWGLAAPWGARCTHAPPISPSPAVGSPPKPRNLWGRTHGFAPGLGTHRPSQHPSGCPVPPSFPVGSAEPPRQRWSSPG